MVESKQKLIDLIDRRALPVHIALIMDGNGRWARQRNLPRVAGHRAGIDAVRKVVEASAELGIKVLTLYAFSKENWKRPKAEIKTLMELLKEFLAKELNRLHGNNIRFGTIGDTEQLTSTVKDELDRAISQTRLNDGLQFNVALNYSGRNEIVQAVNQLLRESKANPQLLEGIREEDLSRYLYTHDLPDPDLLIRTSGEFRISNFLLWQIAYSEIWVTETLWPDFQKEHLYEAILAFQKRERRYGGLISTLARSQ